ncbi:hypothetical protein [Actinoallomurus iriomotensis]|uniref:hypothetical protein n=1 Tax=Actinoallomurus iriomotensis TaxID=478107 RepID=UPI002555D6AB|nr:hypothetical protein [Actinoallomurus iriomotensis]
MLVVLCAGLPMIDSAVRDSEISVPPGSVMQVGAAHPGDKRPVALTVPAGWAVDARDTDLFSRITLRSGPTRFSVSVVTPRQATPRQLWDGRDKIAVLTGGPRAATRPVPATTDQGVTGLAGELAGRGQIGIASVFARPTLGTDVTATGPPEDFRHKADQVRGMVRSIQFTKSAR